jgi:hypothetical protein
MSSYDSFERLKKSTASPFTGAGAAHDGFLNKDGLLPGLFVGSGAVILFCSVMSRVSS